MPANPDPPPVAMQVPEPDGRGEVLDWLQSAFDGVRDDLELLQETIELQQQAMAKLAQADTAATLVKLTEALPETIRTLVEEAVAQAVASTAEASNAATESLGDELRQSLPTYIGDAIRQVVEPSQSEVLHQAVEMEVKMTRSLLDVRGLAGDLRGEIDRLSELRDALEAASEQPEVDPEVIPEVDPEVIPEDIAQVDESTERVDGRLTTLAQKVESLGERPEWQTVKSYLPFRRGHPENPR